MAIITDFRDKAVQDAVANVEKRVLYTPLNKFGLKDFALGAYERFAEQIEMPQSQHTKNAYLLRFNDIIQQSGTDYPPEDIEEIISSFSTEAKLVTTFAPEHLKHLVQDEPPSDDLYTAAIASYASLNKPDTPDMLALIGIDAVKLMSADKYLFPYNGLRFNNGSFSAEAKTFHLIRLAAQTGKLISSHDYDVEMKGKISGDELDYISQFLVHLENVNPLPNKTPLEKAVYKNMRILENTYETQSEDNHNKSLVSPDFTI